MSEKKNGLDTVHQEIGANRKRQPTHNFNILVVHEIYGRTSPVIFHSTTPFSTIVATAPKGSSNYEALAVLFGRDQEEILEKLDPGVYVKGCGILTPMRITSGESWSAFLEVCTWSMQERYSTSKGQGFGEEWAGIKIEWK
jgi:hypothetical protein